MTLDDSDGSVDEIVERLVRDMGKKSSASTTTHRLDLKRFLMIKRTPMTKRTNESMRSI